MCETIEFLRTNNDAQEKCQTWVENIREGSIISETSGKHKLESETDEFIETDSELDSVSECGTKRRKLAVQFKLEKLVLVCEWKNCSYSDKSIDSFAKHVAQHVTELDIKITAESEVYACLWSGCTYESAIDVDIMRHVNFHAFHTKLKCIGMNNRGRTKLPKCRRGTDWKNILDTLPPHECQWESCNGKSFNNYTLFIFHVLAHVENNPRGNKVAGGIQCLWNGCQGNYPSLYKLREHMRVHTKEKMIACPDCGAMFASNTKFHDHCKRQIPLEAQGFQCSHCKKYYPTECLLRDHMRNHVFHYKCDICDMTCDSPSSLSKHVLYRHSKTRNFPCTMCTHAAKTQQDLDSHMASHSSNFACEFEGCTYICKNAYSLDRHIEKVHREEIRWYCCHECPIRYRKSYRLTRHLIETHRLQWLRGHKRFQYILEDDGCYRLQTVRYELIDENSTVKASQLLDQEDSASTVMSTPQHEICQIMPNSEDQSMPAIQNPNIITITIDDLDEHGNIIERKVIEAHETTEMPPSAEPLLILT